MRGEAFVAEAYVAANTRVSKNNYGAAVCGKALLVIRRWEAVEWWSSGKKL
jgi:hypothetical protein